MKEVINVSGCELKEYRCLYNKGIKFFGDMFTVFVNGEYF